MLHHFVMANREELIRRTRARVALRLAPRPTEEELVNGVPLFLAQLGDVLRLEAARSSVNDSALQATATEHGGDLLSRGFTIAQVVYDYGDLCQAITELAMEKDVGIGAGEFSTLNRLLDLAIANAVTEYSRQRDVDSSGAEIRRQGYFAHELRNQLNTAMLAFQAVKMGKVGVTGSTVAVLERSLHALRDLIDRSVSEVRLTAGIHQKERVRVSEFLEELEIVASMDAINRGLEFSVDRADRKLLIDVDRHLFASAVSNVLQNAFKFTRPAGHVWLRTSSTADHVSIDVEDECGGLAPGAMEAIFRPFEQHGANRAGLGLGLAISRRAIMVDGGEVSVRDVPGKGCVFTVKMPRASASEE